MESLRNNETWDLVKLPDGTNPIGNKWVCKRNTNAVGHAKKLEAQIVDKGYSQVEGVDFGDIFSPVAKLTCIILLIPLDTPFDLEIEQMDMNTTFLHGDIEEEIYMKKPKCFTMKGEEKLVYRIKKSLYGLKQSPRMWYQKFHSCI